MIGSSAADVQNPASAPDSIANNGDEFGQNLQANKLLFVDSAVRNVDQLIAGIDSDVEIIRLDAEDGISAIGDKLSDYQNVDSVNILSHGDTNQLQLGSDILTSENIDAYKSELKSWRSSLSDTADLLFWGCNIAGNLNGVDLVNQLSNYTAADVAASDDLTGSAELGGDWDLEYTTGSIEAQTPFTDDATGSYNSLLQKWSRNFENGNLDGFRKQVGTKHGAKVVNNPSGSGKVVRMELRKSDPLVSKKHRAELRPMPRLGGTQLGKTYVYQFKTYIPKDYKRDANSAEIISQWHGQPDPGESYRKPPVALSVKGDKLSLVVRYDTNQRSTNKSIKGSTVWSGNLTKGKWVNWKMEVKWSPGKDGRLKLHQNGKQIVNRSGGNTYRDQKGPYWKFGLYKWDWTYKNGRSKTDKRVIYFDDIHVERKG